MDKKAPSIKQPYPTASPHGSAPWIILLAIQHPFLDSSPKYMKFIKILPISICSGFFSVLRKKRFKKKVFNL
jgi:hypothetical protein